MKKIIDKITSRNTDFAKWYTDVLLNGKLISYGPFKGSIVYKPLSFGIWELIYQNLNKILQQKLQAKNVYFPLLIPENLITKEKKHVQGFSPELVTVTQVGEKKLANKLFIRPTSEVLFADFFSKEINSYQDLPLVLNQWTNVLRWEKTTNPFLRNSEFLWQEGHTCHKAKLEAQNFSYQVIKIYEKFLANFLALPVLSGKKTDKEKFAGAKITYTCEALMQDKKSLQVATSHFLGNNFAKAFEIKFKDEKNLQKHVFQTSWGCSTRLIGALIMVHGDDRGLVLPPKIAPVQIDILTIFNQKNEYQVKDFAKKIYQNLSNCFRVNVDNSSKNLGFKAANSEIQGTPLRIQIGNKEVSQNFITFVDRITLKKEIFSLENENLIPKIKIKLEEIQYSLYQKALVNLEKNLVEIKNKDHFYSLAFTNKFFKVPVVINDDLEREIQEKFGLTTRCILLEDSPFFSSLPEKCIFTNKENPQWIIFAKAY